MTQTEKRQNQISPNLMSSETAGIIRNNIETLAAVQEEFLDALSKANRVWIAYFNEEAALTSNFTEKLTKTKSIPDAAAAYQEWMSQHMELLSKQAQKVLAESQDFTKACTQIVGNERGLGSS